MSRTSMITVEAKPFMKIVSKIVSIPHSINSLPPRRFDSSQVVSLSMLHVVLMPTNLLRLHFGIMLPITITRSPIRQFATTLMSTLIFSCPSDMLISINKNTVCITVNIIVIPIAVNPSTFMLFSASILSLSLSVLAALFQTPS